MVPARPRDAPIQVMEPESLDDQIAGFRQHHLCGFEARYFGHQFELLDLRSVSMAWPPFCSSVQLRLANHWGWSDRVGKPDPI